MKHAISVATLALIFNVCANAQTIADLARKERAKRQTEAQGRRITNENLPAIPLAVEPPPKAPETPTADAAANTNATPATSDAEAKPQAEPAATTEAETERGEEWWREQFEAARTEVRRQENQVAVAELQLNAANRDFLTRSYDPDGRGNKAIADATSRLAAARTDLDIARTKVSQLEEDLRRSGEPAGWGR